MTQLQWMLHLFNNIHYLKDAKGEDAIANQVAIELRNLSLDGKLNAVWFHVPNEHVIRDNVDRARIRKRQCLGMISGAPDFIFLMKDKSLQIELKTDTGVLSDNQKSFKKWPEDKDVPYIIAKSWNDVKNTLKQHGFTN